MSGILTLSVVGLQLEPLAELLDTPEKGDSLRVKADQACGTLPGIDVYEGP